MKKENKNIQREIERIIHSGVKSEKVTTTPFFTTRVMGKIEQLEVNSYFFQRLSYFLKPAIAFIILINVFNLFVYNPTSYLSDNQNNQLEYLVDEYASIQSDFIISDEFLIGN